MTNKPVICLGSAGLELATLLDKKQALPVTYAEKLLPEQEHEHEQEQEQEHEHEICSI